MAEIQADKDQLRAEFAMSTRRLELSVEQMKAKTTSQLAELGKKTDAINRLKMELGEKTAEIFTLEAREKALKDQLHTTEGEHSVKIGSLREAERALAEKESELARLAANLNERSIDADSQRIEVVALRTQVEAMKNRVASYDREAQEIGDRLERERRDASLASSELSEERAKGEKLGDRVAQLERALVAQTTEGEILGRRVQELEARLADQTQRLSERDRECKDLRDQVRSAHETETTLRSDMANAAARGRTTTEGLKTEKSLVENQLMQSREEQAKLQSEIAAMKREAEQSWASERVENALLRERINDIAVEIARLTVALEGQGSPIEAMLAAEASGINGSRGYNGDPRPVVTDESGRGSLADRIRALQNRASRVPSPN
jgi:chromosome segregation ATPase